VRIRVLACSCRSHIMIGALGDLRAVVGRGRAEIEMVGLPAAGSPGGMECWYEEALAGPYIIDAVRQAEQGGCSAVVLDCILDPCLRAARQAVSIPVIGPGQATLAFMACLAERFSLVAVTNSVKTLWDVIRRNGFAHRVVDVAGIDVPLTRLVDPDAALISEMHRVCGAEIEKGAEAIALGCTGMSRLVAPLMGDLPVPLVEPATVAIHTAMSMVEMGVSHSKVAYPFPPVR